MSASETTEGVVDAYFAAIRDRDGDALRRLFTDDAELVTATGFVHGRDAIAQWYEQLAFTADELVPEPGPYLEAGDRVTVEIRLTMNGRTTLVGDVFTIADDGIRRLAVYLGPEVD